MSDQPSVISTPLDMGQRVRDNAGSAALTGALLVVYGFFMFAGANGTGIFRTGEVIFLLSMKVGGLAMLGVAIWSAFGHLPALLGDAVVSSLVGLGLIISAILLTIGGGFGINYALYVIFGLMLLRSAVGVGVVYFALRAQVNAPEEEEEWVDPTPLTAGDDDSSFLSGMRKSQPTASADSSGQFEPIIFDKTKAATPKRKTIGDSPDDAISLDDIAPAPPPEGHLARFAKRDPS